MVYKCLRMRQKFRRCGITLFFSNQLEVGTERNFIAWCRLTSILDILRGNLCFTLAHGLCLELIFIYHPSICLSVCHLSSICLSFLLSSMYHLFIIYPPIYFLSIFYLFILEEGAGNKTQRARHTFNH